MKLNKLFLLGILLMAILMIGTVSAADNSTDGESISINDGNVLKASNDYYFNASAVNDGDGSQLNPYKYLSAERIKANSNLYLADGEYVLDVSKNIEEVKIIGSNVEKTIIRYNGVAFTVNNKLTVNNVTFIGASINNNANFTAFNTIFINGHGSVPDSYGNSYGGAIYTYNTNPNACVNINNCTFKNNHAQYGGAVYMGAGILDINNSLFFNNYAYNYGGAIACDYISGVTISKSRFFNSKSVDDAGGCIYLRESNNLIAKEITIVNSSSTFGGAITALNTDVSLSNVNMSNNHVKYDGGAIYQMYGSFTLLNSIFNNNSAFNGGAIFIDNSTCVFIRSNAFTDNKAANTGGAIYSLLNKLNSPFGAFNRFTSNKAIFYNDYYDTSKLNLTIGDGNYSMYRVHLDSIDVLPSEYNSWELNLTTEIKDQQASGNCWAFTALAVLESCILKAGGEKLDLSEENMKNIIELYSDYGWKMDTNEGGYDYMPWAYLTSWLGPVNESDDLFDDKSTLSAVLKSIMHVQNILFLKRNNYTENDEIKKAIMNYGAVATSMYFDSYYYSSVTGGYFCWINTSGNHAVTIVGWDDNYSKDNFKWSGSVEGDGAWIVRNSWGSNWGDEGYFYVSYYDNSFCRINTEYSAYTFILNDTIRYDKNYQYDIAGVTDYFLNSSSKVWYKNKFTATSDEFLAAVSTYFKNECNWTASVYVNGQIKDTVSGSTDQGYYTFNLNRLIPLKKEDVFEVVFNITTLNEAYFPISESVKFNKEIYGPNISYVSYDGINWRDLYNLSWIYSTHYYTSQVACIKAFTIVNPINTFINLTINKTGELFNITAIVRDEYGNLAKYGNVTFNINGKNQCVFVENGRAFLLCDLIKKTNLISATFDAEGYNSSTITAQCSNSVKILVDLNITKWKNTAFVNVSASNNINETFTILINNNSYDVDSVNGHAYLKLNNLSNGFYNVKVLLNESEYEFNNVYSNFIIQYHQSGGINSSVVISGDSAIINIKIINATGNVTLIVDGASEVLMLNNSQITYKINSILPGSHSLVTIYGSEEEFYKFETFTVPKKDSSINLIFNEFKTGEKSTIIAEVTPNAGGNVSFDINGTVYLINLSKTNKLEIIFNKSGEYNIAATYLGDNYYNSSKSRQYNLTVKDKLPANISIKIPQIIHVGDNVAFNISHDTTGEIKVYINGIIREIKDDKINFTALKADSYTIEIIAFENSDFKSFNEFFLFDVVKNDANISLNMSEIFLVGETIVVNPVTNSDGQLNITINGEVINSSYLIPFKGTFTVTVKSDETDMYKQASYTTSFTAIKRPCEIKLNVDVGNGNVKITVDIDDNATGEVIVGVNGTSYSVNLNNSNMLELNLEPGIYLINARYPGDNQFESNVSDIYTIAVMQNTQFNINNGALLSVYAVDYGAGERVKEFNFKLTDLKGKPIKNAQVTFIYNSNSITKVNDGNGNVYVGINSKTSGLYSCKLLYGGNQIYNPTSIFFTVKVIKKPVLIKAKSKTFKAKSKIKKYAISLKTKKCSSDNGKTYLSAGKKVILKLKSKTYTAKINKKGIAVFKLKITKKGKFKAIVKFKGDKTYLSASKKVTIKIK